MTHSVTEVIVNATGFTAGALVAVAILPQIYRVHHRRSATDMSLTRLTITVTGVTMQVIYLAYFKMWTVVIPLSCELAFFIYLLSIWVYFEGFCYKKAGTSPSGREGPIDTDAAAGVTSRMGDGRSRRFALLPAV